MTSSFVPNVENDPFMLNYVKSHKRMHTNLHMACNTFFYTYYSYVIEPDATALLR